MTLYIRVQFFKQIGCVFGTEATKVLVFQKEVHTQIWLGDDGRVLDSELTNAWQNKILQGFGSNDTRSIVDQEDVRRLERELT